LGAGDSAGPQKEQKMNIEELISQIEATEVEHAEKQVERMETEEVSVLGPMNMLAFD
jgi:hypothetical protein